MATSQYPNEAVPDQVKDSYEYGLSVGRYIWKEQFTGQNTFYDRRDKMMKVRNHMKGDVDVSQFTDLLGIDEDASNLALNWEPPRLLAKYINVVADGFPDDIYRVKAFAIDAVSNKERMLFIDSMKNAMLTKGFNQQFNQSFGEKTGMQFGMPENQVPETNEELELGMKLNYKQKREIAAEISIRKVLKYNAFDNETRQKGNEYMCNHGEAGFRLQRRGGLLTIRLMDPINVIYPRDTTNSNDKRDTKYFGEALELSIGQLKHLAEAHGNPLTNQDLEKIMNAGDHGRGQRRFANSNQERNSNQYDDDEFVTIIDFAYKTTRNIVRKKSTSARTGAVKLSKKDQSWTPKSSPHYEKIMESYDVWYEGVYIPGMEKLLGYKLFEDMPRKKGDISKTYGPFVYYELSTESLGNRILTYAEQIYITYLKIQQLALKLRPKGIAIDISRLADIDIGDSKLTPWDVIKIYNEEGNLIFSGEDLAGDAARGAPIIDLPGDDGAQLTALMRLYDMWIQRIREDTGVNEARDATSPSPEAGLGVQEQALQTSLNATKHIERGVLNLYLNLSNTILAHVQHMVASGHNSKMLESLIGEFSYDVMEAYLKLNDNEFNIALEMRLTEKDKARIFKLANDALVGGQITLPESIEVQEVENLQLAKALLSIKIDKRTKMVAEQKQMEIQAQAQADQMKVEDEIEKAQIVSQIAVQEARALSEIKTKSALDIHRGTRMIDLELGSSKVDEAAQIEDFKSNKRKEENQIKDDNKKTLVDKQSTQQSELSDQKAKGSPPKNFESANLVDDISNQ